MKKHDWKYDYKQRRVQEIYRERVRMKNVKTQNEKLKTILFVCYVSIALILYSIFEILIH